MDMDYLLETPDKIYVAVNVDHFPDGKMLPCSIIWPEDGRRYSIDRITDIQRAASRKAGGCGLRFTCYFGNKKRYLFLEGDNHENACFFLERGEPQ